MANKFPALESKVRAPAAIGTTQLIEHAVMLLLFAGLLLGVLAVLQPFATAILFGTILAIAAWLTSPGLRSHIERKRVARRIQSTGQIAMNVDPRLDNEQRRGAQTIDLGR